MNWVDIIVVIILIISFFGGLKEGAVKNTSSLLIMLVAIFAAGRLYYLIASLISFLPGTNWENFFGFFITMALISVILHLVLFIPRKIIQNIWNKGALFRLLGGAIGILNAGVGFVVITLVLSAYPIISWLEENVSGSAVLEWLVETLIFVQAMLPEVFQQVITTV